MGRPHRIVYPGVPHHIVHKGNKGNSVFHTKDDNLLYLSLLKHYSGKHGLRVLSYCLMTNHVHIVAIPEDIKSMENTVRDTHYRYSFLLNQKLHTSGHNWQNRYFSCPCDELHGITAMFYVELNPVRAGIVADPREYPWSSAGIHTGRTKMSDFPDLNWWGVRYSSLEWTELLQIERESEFVTKIRKCTYSGSPFGSSEFVERLTGSSEHWQFAKQRGRPKKLVPGTNFV